MDRLAVDESLVPQGGLAMLIIFISGISILLQFAAVILAWRMIPITGGRKGWMLICAAIFMMAVRRCITLFLMIYGGLSGVRESASADDWITLVISAFMVAGLLRITPLLRSLIDATKNVVDERRQLITEIREADKQIRESLFEKEVLLREIHHRVKNNLASLISLMELQTAHIRDAETIRIFKQLKSQLITMSLVHKNLYQSENLARIDFGEYLRHLINDVFQIFGTGQHISLRTEISNVFLNIDTAIPCGLIVNEIISNALKYAFPCGKPCRDESECEISVIFSLYENNRFMLIISDNGAGLPQDIDWRNSKTLGLKLVSMLSHQIRADLDLDIHNGTMFKLIFAEQKSPDFGRQN